MSVKIKISYEQPEELANILEYLRPVMKSCSVSKNKNGRFNKAYVLVREPTPESHCKP